MFDHISIQVQDPAAAAAFYDTVLEPLGATRILDFGDVVGYGSAAPAFWLGPAGGQGQAREIHQNLAGGRPALAGWGMASLGCSDLNWVHGSALPSEPTFLPH